MIYKILSFLLSILMTVLSPLGICFDGSAEELQPSASIVNEFSCKDINPVIEIEVSKTSFCFGVESGDFVLGGAFRALEITEAKRESGKKILLKTQGTMNQEFGTGMIEISEDATYCEKVLYAQVDIDMSARDLAIAGGLDYEALEKKAAKALITTGIKKIPYVGGIAATALDSTLNDLLGINPTPTNENIMNALEEISNQLKNISLQLDKNTQDILKSLYDQQAFSDFNSNLTSIKDISKKLYDVLLDIESCEASDYYKNVKTAQLFEYNELNVNDFVNLVPAVAHFLDGSQVSTRQEDGIFTKAFYSACADSVFGGEAAMRVADYVNEVNGILSYSFKIIYIVLNAKIYVADNMSDIEAAIADGDEMLEYTFSHPTMNKAYFKDPVNRKSWERLCNSQNESSISKLHNHYFSNEQQQGDEDSVVNLYNKFIAKNWFSFIRSTDYKSQKAAIDFVPISSTICSVKPRELGLDRNRRKDDSGTMVSEINSTLNSNLHVSLTQKEIETIVNHILSDPNNIYLSAKAPQGASNVQDTLINMLEVYGFDIEKGNGTPLFVSNSSKGYSHYSTAATDNRSATYSWEASLYVNALSADAKNNYNVVNKTATDINTFNNIRYYYYYEHSSHKDIEYDRNTPDYDFYYFGPAPVEIDNEAQFTAFISSVAKGKTYSKTLVTLNDNIDLSSENYESIWPQTKYQSAFKGTFDGNFYTISGLRDNTSYSGGGLFRTLGEGAEVRNLFLEDVNVKGSGSNSAYGALAGYVTGNASIASVYIKSGLVSGYNKVGGIVGEITNGSLVMFDCDNSANVTAKNQFAGGIIGASTGNKSQKITLCINSGNIEAASGAAGIVSYLANDSTDQSHKISFCTNNGSIKAANSHTGGIVGHLDTDSIKHDISKNTNTGSVASDNGNAGGIVGFSEGGGNFTSNTNSGRIEGNTAGGILANNEDDSIDFSHSENSGSVYGKSNAGGIAAYLGSNNNDKAYTFKECRNNASVSSENTNAGGIVGHLDTDSTNHLFTGCVNTSYIDAPLGRAGGIIGYSEGGGKISDTNNTGKITGKTAGGIIGENEDDAISFLSCSNSGSVYAETYSGGILGYTGSRSLDPSFSFENCSNSSMVSSKTSYAGGIAGVISSDSTNHLFTNCVNRGSISGHFSTGGHIGKLEGGGKFNSCNNSGTITSDSTCAGGVVGYIVDDGCSFNSCQNYSNITGVQSCGGIVGEAGNKSEDDSFSFTECYNYGSIESSSLNAGGMIGMLQTDSTRHSFDSDKNYGTVKGKTSAGGIIGFMYGGGTIKSCVNTKRITASDSYAGGLIGRIEDDKCNFTDNTSDGVADSPKYCGEVCGYDGYRKSTY